jgi:2-hydroxy-4-carboxymuconate semialdehyde hemiacetal dehydrogenase
MIGHGMMGRWHSEALKSRTDCRLRLLIGRRPEPTEKFAQEFGYRRWSTSLDDLLNEPEIDVVVIASPSEDHAAMAIKALKSGKHTLVEIPLTGDLALELSEGEEHVQRQPAHGGGGIELLGDRDEGDAARIEQLDDSGEVGQ